MSRMPHINVGLFGLGVVGGNVYQVLQKNAALIEEKLGYPIKIKKICELDAEKIKKNHVPQSLITTKPNDILDDPEISIIVELIGNKTISKEIMEQALSLGKHVVTANKAILAEHGPKLYNLAKENEVEILFEAAVGGVIPILRSLREAFVADEIESIKGIINGTCNYILSEMTLRNKDFQDVLKEAQINGYAESDPTADIEGLDTAHKVILLTALAFGQYISLEKIHVEGISSLSSVDIEMAERFGLTIKMLGHLRREGNLIDARIHPTMIEKSNPLASVNGAFNAIMVKGVNSGPSLFYGLGAGGPPTAIAVVGDIIEIARNIAQRVQGVPPLGFQTDKIVKAKIKPMEDIVSEYYLRFTALDKPGVFSKIANALGQNQISISSIYQHGREEGKEVPIVVLTHSIKEKNVIQTVKEIDKISSITKKTQIIRIERNA